MKAVRLRNALHAEIQRLVKEEPLYGSVDRFVNDAVVERIMQARRAIPHLRVIAPPPSKGDKS